MDSRTEETLLPTKLRVIPNFFVQPTHTSLLVFLPNAENI